MMATTTKKAIPTSGWIHAAEQMPST
jgi:hypothetical protein